MKKLIVLLFCIIPLLSGVIELPVNYDPFYKATKIIKHSTRKRVIVQNREISLHLYAIFNNKAYINGKFYAIGEYISGYKLIKIKNDHVVLAKRGTIKVLPLLPKRVMRIVAQ